MHTFSGIAHQKFEQLNELNDSDYSISDNSDESDSDSSTHSNVEQLQQKENNTNITLGRSTRKKDVPFVSIYYIVVYYSCFICYFCI